MAQSNIIAMVKSYCKLYKGGDTNPYSPNKVAQSEWANEYLKFHIWEAERAVVHNFNQWRDIWRRRYNAPAISKEETAEEVYKFAIRSKLGKMSVDDTHDFQKMYFEL